MMTKWDWLLVVVLSAIYLLSCWAMELFMSSAVKAAEITIEPAAVTVVTIKDKIDPGAAQGARSGRGEAEGSLLGGRAPAGLCASSAHSRSPKERRQIMIQH